MQVDEDGRASAHYSFNDTSGELLNSVASVSTAMRVEDNLILSPIELMINRPYIVRLNSTVRNSEIGSGTERLPNLFDNVEELNNWLDENGDTFSVDIYASAYTNWGISLFDPEDPPINGGGSPPVPEPSTILLVGTGLISLAGLGRKKIFKK